MMHPINLATQSGTTEITVGKELSSMLEGLQPPPVLLVDEKVQSLHQHLLDPLPQVMVPSGEKYKTVHTAEQVCRQLIELGADRSSFLVGVGGGVTTDIAGYVASTFLRGIKFGFISTTLLGQVDASIGGKNGVNLDGYKNMIGTIRQPSFVWCDLSMLETLEKREYAAGIAEVIKYGAIMDRGFFDYLNDQMMLLLSLDHKVLEKVVTTSASIKADIVEQDERESGLRKLLNFGHTIGHAIERNSPVLHGEAVAAGMIIAARFSNNLGMLPSGEVDRLQDLIALAGLPTEIPFDPEVIFDNIRMDKKKIGTSIHFVLMEEMGKAVVKEISFTDLKLMLHDLY